ncbi:hypothetical protein ACFQ0M_05650 [Kitasatospora aburaviensis]
MITLFRLRSSRPVALALAAVLLGTTMLPDAAAAENGAPVGVGDPVFPRSAPRGTTRSPTTSPSATGPRRTRWTPPPC